MTDDIEAPDHAEEVEDLCEWILYNLDNEGVSTGIAAHALGFALATITAGQPKNQHVLLEGIITAMRNTFNDAMTAREEIMGERESCGATLQ
jgi:hypothetical protein